jgi:hypothetical protein
MRADRYGADRVVVKTRGTDHVLTEADARLLRDDLDRVLRGRPGALELAQQIQDEKRPWPEMDTVDDRIYDLASRLVLWFGARQNARRRGDPRACAAPTERRRRRGVKVGDMYSRTVKRRIKTTIEQVTQKEAEVEIEIPQYACSGCHEVADATSMTFEQRSTSTGGTETIVRSWCPPKGWLTGRYSTGSREVGDEIQLCPTCLAKALAAVGIG